MVILPTFFDQTKSKDAKHQLARWNLILEKWDLALKEGKDTIVIMDDNIYSNLNLAHNKKYQILKLADF